ncbi:MAG: heavy-metal-associated domain-containing protein [Merismopedia sp. SIO2A8]|nr:heavy-metal-associated domain-containing protein [Symploca sp. SIO2B6]NET53312.1 heavy-metal-associated domain-containing protein [Merismopedia sp. SIO2A8]
MMNILQITVDGMSCRGCASKVEAIALDISGVIDCVVNFDKKHAVVRYNAETTTVERIQQTLQTAGYGVQLMVDA